MTLSEEVLERAVEGTEQHKLLALATIQKERWERTARPEQLPPKGDWRVWYIQAGRGAGKSKAGAEWLSEMEALHPPGAWGIIAPTFADGRDTCVEEQLYDILGKRVSLKGWNRSIGELFLRSGSRVYVDGADDGALRIQGKNLRGAWCVAKGELVLTGRGAVPIEKVRLGDLVATRKAWREVTATALTHRDTPVVKITTEVGASLRCTEDHQLWVVGSGWKRARELTVADTLCLWKSWRDLQLGMSGTTNAGIETARATTKTGLASLCTRLFGSATMAIGFLTEWLSTTLTTTDPTTNRPILSSCQGPIILQSTDSWVDRIRWMSADESQRLRRIPGDEESLAFVSAITAARPISRLVREPDSALHRVAMPTLVKSIEPDGPSDVYDLTVDGEHEFFANGLLVKNCDEIGLWNKWDLAWNESLAFAVRIEPAKIVATGTPKMGHGLVRQLVSDETVVKTRMRTADNALNLPAHVIKKLYEENKGTLRGKQELDGEWISALEGDALKRSWWRYYDKQLLRPSRDGRAQIGNGEIKFQWVIVSCDTPLKDKQASDNVAIQVWGADHAMRYLLDAENRQMSYDQAKRAVREKVRWARWNWRCQQRILIENAGYGPDLALELKREIGGVETVKANMIGNKGQRALAAAGDLETGQCFLPGKMSEDSSGPDPSSPALTLSLVDECALFQVDGSHDSHDDQVDAWSQCMNWLRSRQTAPMKTWSSFKSKRRS